MKLVMFPTFPISEIVNRIIAARLSRGKARATEIAVANKQTGHHADFEEGNSVDAGDGDIAILLIRWKAFS